MLNVCLIKLRLLWQPQLLVVLFFLVDLVCLFVLLSTSKRCSKNVPAENLLFIPAVARLSVPCFSVLFVCCCHDEDKEMFIHNAQDGGSICVC